MLFPLQPESQEAPPTDGRCNRARGRSNVGSGETVNDNEVCHPGLDYLRSVGLRSRVGISQNGVPVPPEILKRADGDDGFQDAPLIQRAGTTPWIQGN